MPEAARLAPVGYGPRAVLFAGHQPLLVERRVRLWDDLENLAPGELGARVPGHTGESLGDLLDAAARSHRRHPRDDAPLLLHLQHQDLVVGGASDADAEVHRHVHVELVEESEGERRAVVLPLGHVLVEVCELDLRAFRDNLRVVGEVSDGLAHNIRGLKPEHLFRDPVRAKDDPLRRSIEHGRGGVLVLRYDHAREEILAVQLDAVDVDDEREDMAVLMDSHHIAVAPEDPGLAGEAVVAQEGVVHRREGSGHEHRDIFPDHLPLRVPEEAVGRLVGLPEDAKTRDHKHGLVVLVVAHLVDKLGGVALPVARAGEALELLLALLLHEILVHVVRLCKHRARLMRALLHLLEVAGESPHETGVLGVLLEHVRVCHHRPVLRLVHLGHPFHEGRHLDAVVGELLPELAVVVEHHAMDIDCLLELPLEIAVVHAR
mmetsp:Transcript_29208/g.93340  ORF Transcript_29208/g.93340 Transcript_29208/m.93340 type:complete len:433 (+) Transcript_29208:3976-5274(+)